MSDYDLLVAGGGPSGAATAFYAARAGLRVALLDRARFPRDKACGGLLTPRLREALPELWPHIEPVVECPTGGVALYSPALRYRIDHDFGDNTPWNIRREAFDHALFRAAGKAGAELLEGHRVTGVTVDGGRGDGVTLETSRGAFTAPLAVGACGPHDPLARHLREVRGLRPWSDRQLGTALVQEVEVGRDFITDAYGDEHRLLVHFRPSGIEGYGWVFPKATTLNIGFGGYNRTIKAIDVHAVWRDYIALLRRDHYFPIAQDDPPVKGAPLPMGGPLKATVADRVMVVGDAAGHVSPLSGEGIYYGLHAGRLAAETAVAALAAGDFSAEFLQRYHRAWRATFGKELRDLRFFARLALVAPERMVYYGTRDARLREMFADLFLGLTPGGPGKLRPMLRVVRDVVRYPWFGWG